VSVRYPDKMAATAAMDVRDPRTHVSSISPHLDRQCRIVAHPVTWCVRLPPILSATRLDTCVSRDRAGSFVIEWVFYLIRFIWYRFIGYRRIGEFLMSSTRVWGEQFLPSFFCSPTITLLPLPAHGPIVRSRLLFNTINVQRRNAMLTKMFFVNIAVQFLFLRKSHQNEKHHIIVHATTISVIHPAIYLLIIK